MMVDYLSMLHPHLTGPLLESIADTQAVLVNEARHSVMSTLVQSTEIAGQERQHLTFDAPDIVAPSGHDLNGFVAGQARR
jgi:hypothetical protein